MLVLDSVPDLEHLHEHEIEHGNEDEHEHVLRGRRRPT